MTAPSNALLAELTALRADDARWAATCFTIRDKHQRIATLHLNAPQRDVIRRENEQLRQTGQCRQYILKARQAGFSTMEQMKSLKLVTTTHGIDALTIADKQKRTDKIYQITERALKYFPPALLPKMGNKRSKEVSFPNMESNFFTDTAGGGDAARGLTLGRLHCSEFAYFEDPREVLAAAVPSLVPEGSVVVLETTASMYDDDAHVFWREAEEGGNGYEAIFYPWWMADPEGYQIPLLEDDELGLLSDEEVNLTTNAGLTLPQIKWRRKQIREFGIAFFLREYAEDAESCWMASGQLYYELERLKQLMVNAPAAIAIEGDILIYRRSLPSTHTRIIIGGDTAEGGGGAHDRFTWEARSEPTGTLLATYSSVNATPESYTDTLAKYAKSYGYPLLVIEKNAHGITVLRRLRDVHHYPVERIYHRMSYGENNAAPQMTMGWFTSAETKPLMLEAGRTLLNSLVAVSRPFVKDCFAVRYDKEGRLKLNGRDAFVAGVLAVIGRDYPHLPLGMGAIPPTIVR